MNSTPAHKDVAPLDHGLLIWVCPHLRCLMCVCHHLSKKKPRPETANNCGMQTTPVRPHPKAPAHADMWWPQRPTLEAAMVLTRQQHAPHRHPHTWETGKQQIVVCIPNHPPPIFQIVPVLGSRCSGGRLALVRSTGELA